MEPTTPKGTGESVVSMLSGVTGPATPESRLAQMDPHRLGCFSAALICLKAGGKVARKGWNGKGMWLELQWPSLRSKMTLPYVYLNYPAGSTYPDGAKVPWLASQTDLLESDWVQVP